MFMHKIALAVATLCAVGSVNAAVSVEEANKLGTSLTPIGAEMAGNEEGTIPSYTGGLTELPAGFEPGSGIRPDPFSDEKPMFSITAENMDQYADKLTEGVKALMKQYPSYRIDVYPTHRTAAVPGFVAENTRKCATTATTSDGGLSMSGCQGGVPFPIPKDGFEIMWNHLTRFVGVALTHSYKARYVPASGSFYATAGATYYSEFPYYGEGDSNILWKGKTYINTPPRRAGENLLAVDPLNIYKDGRVAHMYLPGQRRVKLAPTIAFDTPRPSSGGISTYDDQYIFQGSMERFDFKLIGKKEVFIPYNTYKMNYHTTANELFTPTQLNPDVVRWELHRVWVVEATLREGSRHIYSKRRFYVDEDTWTALTSDQYDMRGDLWRVGFAYQAPSYEVPAPMAEAHGFYDLDAGAYEMTFWTAEDGGVRYIDPLPAREWSPQSLSGSGIR